MYICHTLQQVSILQSSAAAVLCRDEGKLPVMMQHWYLANVLFHLNIGCCNGLYCCRPHGFKVGVTSICSLRLLNTTFKLDHQKYYSYLYCFYLHSKLPNRKQTSSASLFIPSLSFCVQKAKPRFTLILERASSACSFASLGPHLLFFAAAYTSVIFSSLNLVQLLCFIHS